MMNRRQELRRKVLPGAMLGLAGALLAATLALLVAVGYPRPADALPDGSKGSNCAGCHGTSTSKPSKKKAATAAPARTPAVEPAAPAISEVPPGRALDYIPWTLVDPYYSHFLYRSDDYNK